MAEALTGESEGESNGENGMVEMGGIMQAS